jgi:hypothetical protein
MGDFCKKKFPAKKGAFDCVDFQFRLSRHYCEPHSII